MIRKTLLSSVVFMLATGASFAADMPSRVAPAPYLSPAPIYNWTGFYVGVNAGYGWGTQNPLSVLNQNFDRFDYSVKGGLFGGTIGAQIQAGHVVMGVEGDMAWSNVNGGANFRPGILGVPSPFVLSLRSNHTSLATLRTRVGYAMDNWLFYGTTGIALQPGTVKGATLPGAACGTLGLLPRCNGSTLHPGIAMGLGVEYGITQNWSAKAEYLFVVNVAGVSTEKLNVVRLGLNYRFGG
jgi:outer membrane immunogenic protein